MSPIKCIIFLTLNLDFIFMFLDFIFNKNILAGNIVHRALILSRLNTFFLKPGVQRPTPECVNFLCTPLRLQHSVTRGGEDKNEGWIPVFSLSSHFPYLR